MDFPIDYYCSTSGIHQIEIRAEKGCRPPSQKIRVRFTCRRTVWTDQLKLISNPKTKGISISKVQKYSLNGATDIFYRILTDRITRNSASVTGYYYKKKRDVFVECPILDGAPIPPCYAFYSIGKLKHIDHYFGSNNIAKIFAAIEQCYLPYFLKKLKDG